MIRVLHSRRLRRSMWLCVSLPVWKLADCAFLVPPKGRSPRVVGVPKPPFFVKATEKEQEEGSESLSSSLSLNSLVVEESQYFADDSMFPQDTESLLGNAQPGQEPSNNGFLQKSSLPYDDWEGFVLWWTPLVVPVLAYVLYDDTAYVFRLFLEVLANNKWVAVDGGAYQAKIIAPSIDGVVVPAISILFATQISTTYSTLMKRQRDIRTALNMEAGQLRILQSLLQVFPTLETRMVCRRYLAQYTSRLIAESQPKVPLESLEFSMDTELNALMDQINRISANTATDPPDATTTNSPKVPGLVLANCFTVCGKLFDERAKRITALRSQFPPLHYFVVAVLAVSICIAFLLESNQALLVFLNAVQLRILWTMLVGTFSALAIVCYDLGNPFQGSYQISPAVDQLYTIRLTLQTSLYLDQQQEQEEQRQKTPSQDDAENINGSAEEPGESNQPEPHQ